MIIGFYIRRRRMNLGLRYAYFQMILTLATSNWDPLNGIHRRSDLSLWIGRKDLWGQGYGSETIGLMADYAFNKLNLYKLTAGIYLPNIGSRKAFEKAGFKVEATLRNQVWFDGSWTDVILMVKFNE